MSVSNKEGSEATVTSEYKLDVIIISDDDQLIDKKKVVTPPKEMDAASEIHTRKNTKFTRKEKKFGNILDDCYEIDVLPSHNANKRALNRPPSGSFKRRAIDHASAARYLDDSSDESTF